MDFGLQEFLIIKASCEGVNRRLTLKKSADLSRAALELQVKELFKISEGSEISITYVDSEGDFISLEDDRDVKDALFVQKLNPLRLHVNVLPSKEEDKEVEESEARQNGEDKNAELIHVHVKASDAELKESFKSSELLLGLTLSRISELVTAAIKSKSSLNLELRFEKKPSAGIEAFSHSVGPFVADPAVASEPQLPLNEVPNGSMPDAIAGDPSLFFRNICSVCKLAPIVGPSYQSLVRPEYELCLACYKNHGLEGQFKLVMGRKHQMSPSPSKAVAVGGLSSPSFRQQATAVKYMEGERDGSPAVVHEGIECDICRMCPIIGTRYRSNVLADFDLCQDCYENSGEKECYDEILQPLAPSPHPPVKGALLLD